MAWTDAAREAAAQARAMHAKGKTPMGQAPKQRTAAVPADVYRYSQQHKGVGIGDLAWHPRLGSVRVEGWRMQKGKEGIPFGHPFAMAGGRADRVYVARVDSRRVTVGRRLPVVPSTLRNQGPYGTVYGPRGKK